jgi:hypothetical protein
VNPPQAIRFMESMYSHDCAQELLLKAMARRF